MCVYVIPTEAGMKAGGRQPLQLRDVAAALRKEDDAAGVLAALSLVDGLVEAAPDELDQYAGVHTDGCGYRSRC